MNAAQISGADDSNAGVGRAIELLKQALEILDKCAAPPEIGARLHEIIAAAEGLI